MASRGPNMVLSMANRIRTKLQSALEATVLEVEDVSYQHAAHAARKGTSTQETHFNLKIVSPKFDGQSLVKRHRIVWSSTGSPMSFNLDCTPSLLSPKRLRKPLPNEAISSSSFNHIQQSPDERSGFRYSYCYDSFRPEPLL